MIDKQRLIELQAMPYSEYLQTPEWITKRDQILAFDGYRCRVCNANKDLNVHHRTYERGRGNEDLNDLTTLCQSCHTLFHKGKEQEEHDNNIDTRLDRFGKHSFETFHLYAGIRKIVEECVDYACDPNGWLLLIGPHGSGKTHLAVSIARACLESGLKTLIYSTPDLLDDLRSAEQNYHKLFSKIKEVELLVLDDFGIAQSTPWANEKMFQLLNHRYNLEMFTVIVSDLKGIQNTDERILSRLSDIHLVTSIRLNHARDYRMTMKDS